MLCRVRLENDVSFCLFDRRLAEVSPVLRHRCPCMLPARAARPCLHFMPWRRFVSSVVRTLAGPHNVATEAPRCIFDTRQIAFG